MIEKPGWWSPNKTNIDSTNSQDKKPVNNDKQIGWRVWHTVAQVEVLLEKQRKQKK